jgi:hypothetical protein
VTIVAGVSTTFDAVIVADSRLSVTDPNNRPKVVRDICQNIAVANGWSLARFAGDLCLGRDLLGWIVRRLRDTPADSPNWLRDDELLRRFIEFCIGTHMRNPANHKACRRKPTAILVAWMDYSRSIVGNDLKPGDELWTPGTEIVVIRMPSVTIERIRWGIGVIGSGETIAPQMRQEAMLNIANFARGAPHPNEYRCYFVAEVVRSLLAGRGGEPTIGGLYQMAYLNREGVGTVPFSIGLRSNPDTERMSQRVSRIGSGSKNIDGRRRQFECGPRSIFSYGVLDGSAVNLAESRSRRRCAARGCA